MVDRRRKEYQERGEAAFTERALTGDQALVARVAELEGFCGRLALENGVKKSPAPGRIAERYARIRAAHEEHPDLSMEPLCEVLQVNRSRYYACPAGRAAKQADVDLRGASE